MHQVMQRWRVASSYRANAAAAATTDDDDDDTCVIIQSNTIRLNYTSNSEDNGFEIEIPHPRAFTAGH